ncbi:MAG: hypothetical protein AAGK30_04490 [Pseudomonadota bacterium]
MKMLGLGGLIGLVVGIGVAEWLGNPNDTAYYSVVVFGALVGAAIARAVAGKAGASDK